MSEPRFVFDREFQINILALMLQRHEFLLTCQDILKPEYFEDKILIWFYQTMVNFYQKTKEQPTLSPVLSNELRKSIQNNEIRASEKDKYIEVLSILKNAVFSPEYIAEELVNFCRRQETKKVMLACATRLDTASDTDWDNFIDAFRKAVKLGSGKSKNLMDYWSGIEDRVKYREAESGRRVIPTGIPPLDAKLNGGLIEGQLGCWLASTGIGKCLQNGTKVIKYNGSFVPVEEVCVGDLLMGPDGTPRTVLSVVNGIEDLCRVIPVKGEPWCCTYDHKLTLTHTISGKLIDITVREYLNQNKTFKHVYKLTKSLGVDFEKNTHSLPIDPYFMGLWFGDGSKCLGNAINPMPSVAITTMDPEVVETINDMASKFGMCVRKEESPFGGKAATYFIIGKKWDGEKWNNELLTLLRYTVGKNADVPNIYLTASREDRSKLLAGFLDSDGSLINNCYEIVQKRKDYADAIQFLAGSLGLASYRADKIVNGDLYHRVHISGDCTFLPMRVAHKISSCRGQKKSVLRTGIVSIEPIGIGNYSGFTLDGDHRFLLSDFTITHNSIVLPFCGKTAVEMGYRVLHFTLELNHNEVAQRYDANWANIPVHDLLFRKEEVVRNLTNKSNWLLEHYNFNDNLRIQFYPTGTATVPMLEADIRNFIAAGWVPDLIIVDYGDLLKPTTSYNDEYADLGRIFVDLRGLAGIFNVPIWTATQTNRSAMSLEVVDMDTIGDSWKKAQISDVILTLCRNKEEYEQNIIRVFGAKNRNGTPNWIIKIPTAFDRMRFFDLDTWDVWNKTKSHLDKLPSIPPPPLPVTPLNVIPTVTRRKPKVKK